MGKKANKQISLWKFKLSKVPKNTIKITSRLSTSVMTGGKDIFLRWLQRDPEVYLFVYNSVWKVSGPLESMFLPFAAKPFMELVGSISEEPEEAASSYNEHRELTTARWR